MLLVECTIGVVDAMCRDYHGYGGASSTKTYAFAVYEDGLPIASFSWQPPSPGVGKAIAPSEPSCVLQLSRMVAVPKKLRNLKHISKPLRKQMKHLIDRTRYPVLVTYHDESQGHTGYVYQCSGWKQVGKPKLRPFYVDRNGKRVSPYSNGSNHQRDIVLAGYGKVYRWEHRVCDIGNESSYMLSNGWYREPTGKVWRSGNPAHRWVRLSQE
jgi:hypothetical protein